MIACRSYALPRHRVRLRCAAENRTVSPTPCDEAKHTTETEHKKDYYYVIKSLSQYYSSSVPKLKSIWTLLRYVTQ